MKATTAAVPLTLSLILMCASIYAHADQDERFMVSRYTSIKTAPSSEQSNPLLTVVSFSFPPAVQTVGQAITYTLEQTGYTIVDASDLPEQAKIMMSLPLPNIQRRFQYVSVKNALAALAGDAFMLLVDPIRRQISFVPVFNPATAATSQEGVLAQ